MDVKENSGNSSNSSIFDSTWTKTRKLQKYEKMHVIECFKWTCSFNHANYMDSCRHQTWFYEEMFDFIISTATREQYSNCRRTGMRYCYVIFFCLQAMYNTRIVYHGVLLLLAAATSTDSTKCSRTIEGVTMPRSNAEGKYHFFMTLFNRTELVYAYMPSTRYSGKNICNRANRGIERWYNFESCYPYHRNEKWTYSSFFVTCTYIYMYVEKERENCIWYWYNCIIGLLYRTI